MSDFLTYCGYQFPVTSSVHGPSLKVQSWSGHVQVCDRGLEWDAPINPELHVLVARWIQRLQKQ